MIKAWQAQQIFLHFIDQVRRCIWPSARKLNQRWIPDLPVKPDQRSCLKDLFTENLTDDGYDISGANSNFLVRITELRAISTEATAIIHVPLDVMHCEFLRKIPVEGNFACKAYGTSYAYTSETGIWRLHDS